MPLQCRSSPYSLMILPSSPSGHVLTSCSAVSLAEGPMRMSRGPGRVKLKPRSGRSSCSRRLGRQSASRLQEGDALLHTIPLQNQEAVAGFVPQLLHCSCCEQVYRARTPEGEAGLWRFACRQQEIVGYLT